MPLPPAINGCALVSREGGSNATRDDEAARLAGTEWITKHGRTTKHEGTTKHVKTYSAKESEIQRAWWVVDATDQTLGRLATRVAHVLRGKHKPIFTPHLDTGDHVIVINCSKVILTGNKLKDKVRYRHSRYPGGLKAVPYGRLMATRPDFVVREAVRGMLPKGPLGRKMLRKLRVFLGPEHAQQAQKPRPLEL